MWPKISFWKHWSYAKILLWQTWPSFGTKKGYERSPTKMPGDNPWVIEYLETVVEEDIPKLGASARRVIREAIEQRLMLDPVAFGKPLRYSLKGHRRLRVGAYRVVYRVDGQRRKVVVVAIKHRKDIYE